MKIVKNNKLTEIYIVIEENIIIKNAADFCLPYLMILYTDLKGGIYVRTQKEFWEDFDVVAVYTIPTTEEKSIRDMVSPEVLKKAKEFTEMIKDGTIKNRHTTLEPEFIKALNEMKGTEKPSKDRFVTRVCENCGRTVFGSVECECYYIGKLFVKTTKGEQEAFDKFLKENSNIVVKDAMNKNSKPQFTKEEAVKLIQIINNTKGTKFPRTIESLKDAGYIISVKSDEPLIVGNTMSYKGKNYLRQLGSCTDCAMYGIECHNDVSVMQFGHKTNCAGTNTIWKSFDDIIIGDSLACMRKDIGNIYVVIQSGIGQDIHNLYGVDNAGEILTMMGYVQLNKRVRLATAEELQEYFKYKK